MTAAAVAVQQALRAALAIPGLPVFDAVLVEAAAPYLTLGPDITIDWSTKTGVGHEHRVQLTVWDTGRGAARTKAWLGEVEARVRALGGSHGGHRIASVVFLRSFVTRDPEGWSQGIAEFRIRTEQL